MDTTAFTLSQENKLPIIVFDMNTKGNLSKVVNGEKIEQADLKPGDKITIGSVTFMIQIDGIPASDSVQPQILLLLLFLLLPGQSLLGHCLVLLRNHPNLTLRYSFQRSFY